MSTNVTYVQKWFIEPLPELVFGSRDLYQGWTVRTANTPEKQVNDPETQQSFVDEWGRYGVSHLSEANFDCLTMGAVGTVGRFSEWTTVYFDLLLNRTPIGDGRIYMTEFDRATFHVTMDVFTHTGLYHVDIESMMGDSKEVRDTLPLGVRDSFDLHEGDYDGWRKVSWLRGNLEVTVVDEFNTIIQVLTLGHPVPETVTSEDELRDYMPYIRQCIDGVWTKWYSIGRQDEC